MMMMVHDGGGVRFLHHGPFQHTILDWHTDKGGNALENERVWNIITQSSAVECVHVDYWWCVVVVITKWSLRGGSDWVTRAVAAWFKFGEFPTGRIFTQYLYSICYF